MHPTSNIPIAEAEFRAKRRQKFLTGKYFELNKRRLENFINRAPVAIARRRAQSDLDPFGEAGLFSDGLSMLRLLYTSGESPENLVKTYSDTANSFLAWHQAYRQYVAQLAIENGEDLRTDGTPIRIEELEDFQQLIEFLSVGVLLGQGDWVRRAAGEIDRLRRRDMLLELLLEAVVPNPCDDLEVFFHRDPYDPLLDSVYTADSAEESAKFVDRFLKSWYKSFEGLPWHNGHLVQTEEYSNYEGYWAFEAAAVCVLKGIDDSSFRDHMVYPKDLADWARANNVVDAIRWRHTGPSDEPLRCPAGRPCPKAGWWFAPADPASRRLFESNELMPELPSAYGKTIWQFDAQQFYTPQSDGSAT